MVLNKDIKAFFKFLSPKKIHKKKFKITVVRNFGLTKELCQKWAQFMQLDASVLSNSLWGLQNGIYVSKIGA